MTIVVDTREKFSNQIKDLLATSIIGEEVPQFEFRCLNLADYLIQNGTHNALIERKSIQDFIGSFRELKPRLAKMRKLDYERTGLLLEGTYIVAQGMIWLREGNELKARMSYKTFSNFLTHQQEMGTRIYHTLGLEETIWKLVYLHNYLPKLDVPVPCLKCGSPQEWLSELPGIGPTTLSGLQEKYSSPMEALQNLPKKSKQLLERW